MLLAAPVVAAFCLAWVIINVLEPDSRTSIRMYSRFVVVAVISLGIGLLSANSAGGIRAVRDRYVLGSLCCFALAVGTLVTFWCLVFFYDLWH